MDHELALLDAAETLGQARSLLDGGVLDLAVVTAFAAAERALSVLIPLPPWVRAKGGTWRPYEYRFGEAAKRFGLSAPDLKRLHKLRNCARFGEQETGDPQPRPLTEAEAIDAIQIAERALFKLTEAEELAEETRCRLRIRLNEEPFVPEEELLEMVERAVGWGQHSLTLDTKLRRLERAFAQRRSVGGRIRWARTVTLRAHQIMNRGTPDGIEGAIALAQRAGKVWSDRRDRGRMIHVLMIQSIGHRIAGRPESSRALTVRAMQIAADDPGLRENVASEESAVRLALGDLAGATQILDGLLAQAESEGHTRHQGLYRQKLGRVHIRAGSLAQAERALAPASKLIPSDYLIAHCVGANILVEFFALAGDKAEAHRWAETVERFVERGGYGHQSRTLQETKQRYPRIW